jgi:hypothetical protein
MHARVRAGEVYSQCNEFLHVPTGCPYIAMINHLPIGLGITTCRIGLTKHFR